MKSLAKQLLPCAFCLLVSGCDDQDRPPPPPPPSFTSLEAIAKAQAKGPVNQPDANVTPDELRVRQLARIKEAQEKALKAQEKELKKQKKEREKEQAHKKQDDPRALHGATADGSPLIEIGRDTKDGPRAKPEVVTPQRPAVSGPPLVVIPRPGQEKDKRKPDTGAAGASPAGTPAVRGVTIERPPPPKRNIFERWFGKDNKPVPKGEQGELLGTQPSGTVRSRTTPEMANTLSALDTLQAQQRQRAVLNAPTDRRDTTTHQLQQVLATSRLAAAAQGPADKEPDPAQRKAEVVDLGGGNPVTPLDVQENPKAPPRPAGQAKALAVTAQGDETPAASAEEIKAALEEQYRTGLSSRDVLARETAFQRAALERRADAIPFLLEELKQNNILAAFAVQCLGAIGQLTDDVESALLRGLSSREGAVRSACMETLGRLRSRRAVQPLLQALKTETSFQVRCACLDALAAIGDRTAIPAVKAKMEQKDEVEFVRSRAALALARLGDMSGRKYIVHNLDSPLPAMQVIGLAGSAQLGEPDIAGHLNAALESGYDEVWTTAVFLFPKLGPARALPLLRTRLESPSEVLRRRAALAMGFLGSDEALPYIERAVRVGSSNERIMGCVVLAGLGRTDKVPLLIEKLQDPHTSVRQTAAVALTRLNAVEAVPALMEAARGVKAAADLPPGLRGAGPDAMERLMMLSCVRILRGEKEDLIVTTLPNRHDNAWPEVDRELDQRSVELLKLFQFVDVVSDHGKAFGVVLKSPEGKEIMYREGEHVASGFRVREIGLPARAKDQSRIEPFVVLVRGNERITLSPGKPSDVEGRRKP